MIDHTLNNQEKLRSHKDTRCFRSSSRSASRADNSVRSPPIATIEEVDLEISTTEEDNLEISTIKEDDVETKLENYLEHSVDPQADPGIIPEAIDEDVEAVKVVKDGDASTEKTPSEQRPAVDGLRLKYSKSAINRRIKELNDDMKKVLHCSRSLPVFPEKQPPKVRTP